jgi:prophage regulatory protein
MERLLRWRELSEIVGLSRQQVDRLEKAEKFPRRVKVGSRGVAWRSSKIDEWVATRDTARKG